ncbi:hypothetical protein BHM03_00058795 [Ensete ventricosum]|nr:hypothetical protein BHM03_00058795 [Ensete ventricosum]
MVHYRSKSPTSAYKIYLYLQAKLVIKQTKLRLLSLLQSRYLLYKPYTLKAAISFARNQEERLNYEARKTRVAPRLVAPKLSPPPTFSRPPQPQKLTRKDLYDRSTKGLCGCCDKLWSLEHKCKNEISLMITPIEEPKLEDTTLEPKENDTP